MAHHVVIVEQDPDDLIVWRYGLADADGQLHDTAGVSSTTRPPAAAAPSTRPTTTTPPPWF